MTSTGDAVSRDRLSVRRRREHSDPDTCERAATALKPRRRSGWKEAAKP